LILVTRSGSPQPSQAPEQPTGSNMAPEIVVTSPSRSKPPPLVVSSPGLISDHSSKATEHEEEPVVKLHVPFDTAPRSRSQSLDFPRGTHFISNESGTSIVISSDGQGQMHLPTLTITPSTPPGTPRCSSPVQIIAVFQQEDHCTSQVGHALFFHLHHLIHTYQNEIG
jgi:hypothetical protein